MKKLLALFVVVMALSATFTSCKKDTPVTTDVVAPAMDATTDAIADVDLDVAE